MNKYVNLEETLAKHVVLSQDKELVIEAMKDACNQIINIYAESISTKKFLKEQIR